MSLYVFRFMMKIEFVARAGQWMLQNIVDLSVGNRIIGSEKKKCIFCIHDIKMNNIQIILPIHVCKIY